MNLPTSLAFTPDGTLLAVGKQNGPIELQRSLDGRQEHLFGGQGDAVTRLAISPTNQVLAAGLQNGEVSYLI